MPLHSMQRLAKGENLKPGDYAILFFDTIVSPGYDRDDPNDQTPIHQLYHTTNREVWIKEIETIEKQNSSGYGKKFYVAFHIDQVASVSINVQVNNC